MDLTLSEQQRMVQQMARDFAQKEIAPVAAENDAKERFPDDILAKMGPLGLLGGPVPEEYGGMGLDYISYALMTEEIGAACSSVRTTLSVQISLVALTILRFGTDEQKDLYLPRLARGEILGCFGLTEPGAGSDPAGMKTMAVRKGDGWVINGSKMWISNGGKAQLALVFAQADPEGKHEGVTAFLVETNSSGFSTSDIHGKLGLRSSNTAILTLQDVFVPQEQVLAKVGDGFKVAMAALDNGRYSVAAGCVGICQASLDASVKYAKQREQFGKPIASFQLVQELIADMTLDTEAARLLVFRAGLLKDQGVRNTRETSIAKLFATEAAVRTANNGIQVHGGYGYSNEYPVERYWRDARVATLYEGTSQIQKLIIGRYATGIDAIAR